MIKFKKGDLLLEKTEAIVNTVNCVGIMGKGIALQFKKKYPQNFKNYSIACKKNDMQIGKMFLYNTETFTNPKYIINFPTKKHWKNNSKIEYIERGLIDLIRIIKKNNIKSISIPPLGCGLGGLDWRKVKSLINNKLKILEDVDVIVFEPKGRPTLQQISKNLTIPQITPGRSALIELMYAYLNGLLDPVLTLLEIHKLMYFLQESGEALKLTYKEAPYGPYAENLRHVLNILEGHFILGYADGGDNPKKQIELLPEAHQKASFFLDKYPNTKRNLNKVLNLVDGFESSFGLELLSTVHWIVKYKNAKSTTETISKVYNWNERKKQFSEHQIKLALKILIDKKWLSKFA